MRESSRVRRTVASDYAALAGAAGLLVAACGGAEKPAAAPAAAPVVAVAPAPNLSKEMNTAVTVRKLKPRAEVPLRELDRPTIAKELRAAIERDVPAERVVGESLFLKMLSLVPPDFDYVGATVNLMQSELAGFYDPKTRSMVLAKGLAPEMRQGTLVHELVHALQDQHFGLGAALDEIKDDADRASALHALAEGDATSAMLDAALAEQGYNSTQLGDDVLVDRLRAGLQGAMPNVPGVLRRSVLAPYTDGLMFVNELRRSGGWELVNEAWAKPPVSTEQLLHPDKYASREGFRTFPAAVGPAATCQSRYQQTIGEQGVRVVLEEWSKLDEAVGAAAGWNGDLAQVYECGQQHALVWRLGYDDKVQAAAAIEVFRAGLGHCRMEPLGVRTTRLSGDQVVVAALVGPGATCEQLSDWVRQSL